MLTTRIYRFLVIVSSVLIGGLGQQLRLVNIVFRHGDRAPLTADGETFPTSPYLTSNFPPYGPSQLTNKGRKRAYELGIHIRNQYDQFLGDFYYPPHIIARSSNTDRTKMSLQLVMAGIFPPVNDQKWNPKLNWQPVVVNYETSPDPLLNPFNCTKYKEELEMVENSLDVQEEKLRYKDLLKNLTEWTGKSFTTGQDYENLYSYLTALYSMELPLPNWTRGIFPEGGVKELALLNLRIKSYTQRLKTLNGGMILRNFTGNMQNAIDETEPNAKMVLLSGHDENIAGLLITLGVFESDHPQYSSAIFMELLEDDGEYYVRISYYLGIPAERTRIIIPGCNELCPFKKFVQLYSQLIPSEEDMKCI
ncbi:venom acid phosphatase Acph-1 [Fopius arisanus]|uniref:acid phosphatase n=1 Tax=Fopius arisanus TaxID=64838 RepID=A0A0C9RFH0_9HYME|nr:PREDICTED: venom acid phosphatase Acph-1-like [Fopius arisanus]